MLSYSQFNLQFSAGFSLKLETTDASCNDSSSFTCFHVNSYHLYPGPHNFTHGLFQQTSSCSLSIRFHANPFFIVLTKLIFPKHCFITSLSCSRMTWFPVSYWIKHKTFYFSPFESCSHQPNASLWTFTTVMQSYGSPYDVFTLMSVLSTLSSLSISLLSCFKQVSLFTQTNHIFIFSNSFLYFLLSSTSRCLFLIYT